MEAIPKTVRDRLAAQQVTADHPDADLLNAYAENTLAAREREGITVHLARCRACRDVMLLAMPEIQAAPVAAAAVPQRRWISRPVVRWLGAATAVVVVGASVVVNKFERSPAAKRSQVVAQITEPAPPSAPVQNAPVEKNEVAADRMYAAPQRDKKEARAQQPGIVAPKASTAGMVAKSRHDEAQSVAAQPGSSVKIGRLDQYAKLQSPPKLSFDTTPAAGAIGGPIQRNNIVTPQSAPAPPPLYNLQVQAQAARVETSHLSPNSQTLTGNGNSSINVSNTPAPQVTTASAVPSAAPVPTTKNDAAMAALMRPPIDAASAESSAAVISRAPGQAGASTSAAKSQGVVGGLSHIAAYNVPNAACALIVDGIRCVQNNHKIEFHHPGANLKVIMSQGNVVWAGGDALLRSSDGGATWSDVKKPVTETITRMSILPDAVYVGGGSGSLWKTADNGVTWVQASPEPATTQR